MSTMARDNEKIAGVKQAKTVEYEADPSNTMQLGDDVQDTNYWPDDQVMVDEAKSKLHTEDDHLQAEEEPGDRGLYNTETSMMRSLWMLWGRLPTYGGTSSRSDSRTPRIRSVQQDTRG